MRFFERLIDIAAFGAAFTLLTLPASAVPTTQPVSTPGGTAQSAVQTSKAQTFTEIYKGVKPAVVLVVGTLQIGGAQSGSGFIFRSTATYSDVVTANHVVEGTRGVDVILDSNLKERYQAMILTRDHVKDVAILRIPIGNRKPLTFLNSANIQEGMSVAVVGYPRAVTSFEEIQGDALRPTVHSGIISAIRLNGEMIQFDAVTDHGDSGGPVIDMSTGKVIAIVRGLEVDPSYASRGLEQPLPGSFFGPSSATINSVISSVSTLSSSISPGQSTQNSAPAVGPTPGTNSASYRVGYVNIGYQDEISQEVDQSIDARLSSDLQSDNSFYLIPVALPGSDMATSEQLLGFCQDNRLNAIMFPVTRWALTDRRATAVVDLFVTDCAGDPFYIGERRKSENRYFSHRAPDREVMDMANDLTDQLEKDFVAFRATHQGAWDTLLKYGLPIDPNDGHYHALFYPILQNGQWRVFGVFPGGPADKAGLKPDDVIVSINGTDASHLNSDQLMSMLNTDSYTLTVKRPGANLMITVHAEQYRQLISELAH